MESLGAEQKQNLLTAIDRAEGPGSCSYISGCVIAQLASIVDPQLREQLEEAERDMQVVNKGAATSPAIGDTAWATGEVADVLQSRGYPRDLLKEIQSYWDKGVAEEESEEDLRQQMRAEVAFYDSHGMTIADAEDTSTEEYEEEYDEDVD